MRRVIILCIVYLGAIFMPLAGLNHYVHTSLRDAAIMEETGDLERQGEIRAQEIENALQSAGFVLEKIELLWQFDGHDPAMMHNHLAQLEKQLAYARALGVVDARGEGLFSSRSHPIRPYNAAATESFARLRGSTAGGFLFTGPSKNSVDGDWQLNLSMAVRDNEGNFKGVIGAIIDPHAYARAFETAVAEGDYVTLLNRDFVMIARSPWRENEIGKSQALVIAYQGFAASGQNAHSGVYTNPFTGEQRIVAVRRLFNDQLVLSTSRSLATGIANWQSLATIISVISLLVMIGGLIALVLGLHMLADREGKARTLAALNSDLQDQTARAERLATVKSEFLATMSHEIRTPMNGVLGMAQALEGLPLEATARDYVGVIRESAESLLTIINDILDYSRLEAGKLKVAPSAIRLPVLMDTMSSLFSSACAQKKLAFRIEIDPAAPASIESDPMRLRQILVNLIGNAVKFTSAGQIILRARPVRLPGDVAGIRFEVEDTGSGISPAVQATIFERFAQADASTSRRFGGTGLGLAICRRLSHLLGGEIGCQSQLGRGALFWIEIPAELPDDDDETLSAAMPYPGSAGPPRVLCVDDNHVNRRIVETLLTPFCKALVLVDSGMAAIRAAETQVFDIVLLDIHMPEMDGIETHHRLRSLPHGRKQRIIALTADVVPEAVARYEIAGFDAIVAKPVELEKLLRAIGVQPAAVA
ncbi:MAG: ATP-binding protein [Ferrovibrio sp.]|uniref:hybrid sensor histidine kinase/response regulator n=1 Tax=Ferrovibrio sp. TaxID=1917215 RepID=UPI002624FAAB|nr:hybrid sensor histidine kinase/response regulator [Ferrovibrio sp.]MCW0233086.1 ATP-binding protein [Ferrovibrio sp.]